MLRCAGPRRPVALIAVHQARSNCWRLGRFAWELRAANRGVSEPDVAGKAISERAVSCRSTISDIALRLVCERPLLREIQSLLRRCE